MVMVPIRSFPIWYDDFNQYVGLMLKNAARNSQFDFSLIKLRKFKFPHQETTWMQLSCVIWLVSPSLLSKFELEEVESS